MSSNKCVISVEGDSLANRRASMFGNLGPMHDATCSQPQE